MSPYTQHLIVSTGRSDWTSRIEDEKDTAVWGRFTADVKASLGRGGEFHDVGATLPLANALNVAAQRDLGDEKADLH